MPFFKSLTVISTAYFLGNQFKPNSCSAQMNG